MCLSVIASNSIHPAHTVFIITFEKTLMLLLTTKVSNGRFALVPEYGCFSKSVERNCGFTGEHSAPCYSQVSGTWLSFFWPQFHPGKSPIQW